MSVALCGVCGAVFIVVDRPTQRASQEVWQAERARERAPEVTIGGRLHRLGVAQRAVETAQVPRVA